MQGAGSAAVFSTTFLWLEMLMPVTNAIGAAYTVAWNVAVQVHPSYLDTGTLLKKHKKLDLQSLGSSPDLKMDS